MKTPSDLGSEGAAYWRKVVKHWELDPHQPAILREACKCLDNIAAAEQRLAKDGPILVDRFGQAKAHPATLLVRDYRGLFARLVRELGLSAATEDSRPPTLTNRYKGRR
jgi:P27 family predicted phage terminase small subunit